MTIALILERGCLEVAAPGSLCCSEKSKVKTVAKRQKNRNTNTINTNTEVQSIIHKDKRKNKYKYKNAGYSLHTRRKMFFWQFYETTIQI